MKRTEKRISLGWKKSYIKIIEQLLMELDLIQSFCEISRNPIIGEVLEKQKKIYEALDIEIPR